MFYSNQWYTCTHTKTIYDICAHNSLPTSAILALGLLEKKDEQFCVGGNNALHKRVLAVLKVATNADTTVENA